MSLILGFIIFPIIFNIDFFSNKNFPFSQVERSYNQIILARIRSRIQSTNGGHSRIFTSCRRSFYVSNYRLFLAAVSLSRFDFGRAFNFREHTRRHPSCVGGGGTNAEGNCCRHITLNGKGNKREQRKVSRYL